MNLLSLTAFFVSIASLTGATSVFHPARPPALPLAVKSPYLSTWLTAGTDGGNGGYLAGEWPTFWQGQVNGWAGMIRVDGIVYTWMGLPGSTTVNQTSYEYTSTKSIFTMDIRGMVQMTITFLSPITPDDFRRQSLVFSYLDVSITSLDGHPHDVQLYADISAEWVSGDRSAIAQWDFGATNSGIVYHKIHRQTPLLFSENRDQAEWGDWYWATNNSPDLTYQAGPDVDVRGTFATKGVLNNFNDANYRAISNNWPVFGFAHNLGWVNTTAEVLFSIGLAQDEAIQYNGTSKGLRPEPSLWKSYFDNGLEALEFFHYDYLEANRLCTALDVKIAQDSIDIAGPNYLTITSLSIRQAFAATQLCGSPENPYLFMKEISSNGNMNTVDVIFPAYPVFLYTNPNILRLLMKPLFEIQESGKYPNTYAMHDIGTHYPNATGHPDGNDEPMPLEECGNMVIMALAYALRGNDIAYLEQHYTMLKEWTGYLVEDALYPANQISTDDFAGPLANQTNLALKGIIGIEAMSAISQLVNNDDDAINYTNIAHDYIQKWQTLGIFSDTDLPHTTLSYGSNDTHGLLYNLYVDRQLGLGLVPQSVYDMQSNFYMTIQESFGVPLDTRHQYTKGDWELFAAAIASPDTRDMFISRIAYWISVTPTNHALTDLYDTVTGNYPQITFIARPVMGSAFALLIMD